jgi:hypothetical protein
MRSVGEKGEGGRRTLTDAAVENVARGRIVDARAGGEARAREREREEMPFGLSVVRRWRRDGCTHTPCPLPYRALNAALYRSRMSS